MVCLFWITPSVSKEKNHYVFMRLFFGETGKVFMRLMVLEA
jgi:hypothetical protein